MTVDVSLSLSLSPALALELALALDLDLTSPSPPDLCCSDEIPIVQDFAIPTDLHLVFFVKGSCKGCFEFPGLPRKLLTYFFHYCTHAFHALDEVRPVPAVTLKALVRFSHACQAPVSAPCGVLVLGRSSANGSLGRWWRGSRASEGRDRSHVHEGGTRAWRNVCSAVGRGGGRRKGVEVGG